ncbi:YHS domain-containing (seleno)protein [Cognatishimia sp.]|uniref:YHS domain-containing (seleno)protein n=1 Tax=Cognatishimia sp. TaxID=2211648 RepID=UPI003513BC0F
MLTRRSFVFTALAAPAAGVLATPAFAMTPEVFAVDGLAIRGYDPVAYFKERTDVEGSAEFSLMWKGAEWRFANAENLADFEADPDRWAPQYGGYCAFAVAKGYTAKTEANAWSIHDDKLYLNFSLAIRARWAISKERFINDANANWPNVLNA